MKLEEYTSNAKCCSNPDLYYELDKYKGGGEPGGIYRSETWFKCKNCMKFHILKFDRQENIVKSYIMEEV